MKKLRRFPILEFNLTISEQKIQTDMEHNTPYYGVHNQVSMILVEPPVIVRRPVCPSLVHKQTKILYRLYHYKTVINVFNYFNKLILTFEWLNLKFLLRIWKFISLIILILCPSYLGRNYVFTFIAMFSSFISQKSSCNSTRCFLAEFFQVPYGMFKGNIFNI